MRFNSKNQIFFAVLVISFAIFVGSYLTFLSISSADTHGNNSFGGTLPSDAFSNAPVSGYTYFLEFSEVNGRINGVSATSTDYVISHLTSCGIAAAQYSQTSKLRSCLFDTLPSQIGVLNVTGYSNLNVIVHHLNAFYVDNQTQAIESKPGWSNCTNPNYGNGTTPCN